MPPFGFDPPRAVGVISLVLLTIAVAALYVFRLAGAWRWIYVGSAIAALYLNVFVGVDAVSAKVAHSYFLVADGDGNFLGSTPKITKQYGEPVPEGRTNLGSARPPALLWRARRW